jgi:ElaB/YqjD/DUF883 family membrane-anchored ribosome-binding protein
MPGKCKTLSARLKRLQESKRINIELRGERGQQIMAQSVLKQAGEKASEAAHKASRAASAAADALENGLASARRAAKQGGYVVTEFFDNTKRSVKRHPIEATAVTFAAGIAAGILIGWKMKRRQS